MQCKAQAKAKLVAINLTSKAWKKGIERYGLQKAFGNAWHQRVNEIMGQKRNDVYTIVQLEKQWLCQVARPHALVAHGLSRREDSIGYKRLRQIPTSRATPSLPPLLPMADICGIQ